MEMIGFTIMSKISLLQDGGRNPDLACFENQQVNRLSVNESDSQPSLRGLANYEI